MSKRINKRNAKFIAALLVVVAILVGAGGFVAYQATSDATAEANNTRPDTKSSFSFTGAPGWRQGPSDETSMALFSDAREDGTSACFTSIELKPGIVNAATELQKQQNDHKITGGAMTQTVAINNTLQTADGDKRYELRQYKIGDGNRNEKAMGGFELGYIQLENHYVKVEGHCDTVEELPTTIAALQAFELNH